MEFAEIVYRWYWCKISLEEAMRLARMSKGEFTRRITAMMRNGLKYSIEWKMEAE